MTATSYPHLGGSGGLFLSSIIALAAIVFAGDAAAIVVIWHLGGLYKKATTIGLTSHLWECEFPLGIIRSTNEDSGREALVED